MSVHARSSSETSAVHSVTSFSPASLSSSYPLLRLPLPGTGPVEFTTGVRDYSVPSREPRGDLGERPDWVAETRTHSHTLSLAEILAIMIPGCHSLCSFYRTGFPSNEVGATLMCLPSAGSVCLCHSIRVRRSPTSSRCW